MRHKRRRAWTGLTAAAVLLPGAVLSAYAEKADAQADKATAGDSPFVLAGAGGEGGEGGGEGGRGGAAPTEFSDAARDPVQLLTALDLIAGHYHAGLAAYRAGLPYIAREQFADPIKNVHNQLAPELAALGVTGLEPLMDKAVALAAARAAEPDVAAAAGDVLAAVKAAAGKAPQTGGDVAALSRRVLADMLNRAALAYSTAVTATDPEPYFEGYGFLAAAKARAAAALLELRPADAVLVSGALSQLGTAFPSEKVPKPWPAEAGEVLAATSKAMLVLGR